MDKKSILLVGETCIIETKYIKGFDEFSTCSYSEEHQHLSKALSSAGFVVEHLPCHKVPKEFPMSMEELNKYDAIILSDIGASSIYIHPDTWNKSKKLPNRLELIRAYVEQGGGLAMVGGYMSFQGVEGKARYSGTPVEQSLPVSILPTDDRIEMPDGINPIVCRPDHPIVKGLPKEWSVLLGYNKLKPKEESEVIALIGSDPLLTIRKYGKGRSLAFASDCAPHWAPPEFIEWKYHDIFWGRALGWVTGLPEEHWPKVD